MGSETRDEGEKEYRAWMLRVWQVEQAQGVVWHASLEDPRTGQRQGFGSLLELVRYLRALLDLAAAGDAARPGRGRPGSDQDEGFRDRDIGVTRG